MAGSRRVEDAPEGKAASGCYSPTETPAPGLSSATKPLGGTRQRAGSGSQTHGEQSEPPSWEQSPVSLPTASFCH